MGLNSAIWMGLSGLFFSLIVIGFVTLGTWIYTGVLPSQLIPDVGIRLTIVIVGLTAFFGYFAGVDTAADNGGV